ncbi:MAG: hypothetical protein M3O36_09230 [Myxococcota bacterium]|nr:hypothetical protein [Myxococcota bacterium]
MELRNLIEVHLDLPRLARDLDQLGHLGRDWAVRQWSRATMATLWDAAKGFRPVTVDDLVPLSVPPLVEMVHEGKSSHVALTAVQRLFCRPCESTATDLVYGFGRHALSSLTGPGYHVAHPSAEAGEVALDYAMLPSEKPTHWPPLEQSSARLGHFLYRERIDVLRGVSAHVSIGRTKKTQSGWTDQWFVLVREDWQRVRSA